MASEIPEHDLVDQTGSFFGEPALLKGENKENYSKLLAAVTADLKPITVFDWFMVYDHTNKYWEEIRFRRDSAALIEGAKPEALEILLRPFQAGLMAFGNLSGVDRNYFSADSEVRKNAALQLASYGITPEQIEAKAMQLVIGPLHMIDRMSGNRETSRRMLRKENEYLRKGRERQQAPNDNTAADGPES